MRISINHSYETNRTDSRRFLFRKALDQVQYLTYYQCMLSQREIGRHSSIFSSLSEMNASKTIPACHKPTSGKDFCNMNKLPEERQQLHSNVSAKTGAKFSLAGTKTTAVYFDANNKGFSDNELLDLAMTDTPISTINKTSFTSTIKMNEVDEEEALDRLMYDLSNDEVSMVIDIFGDNVGQINEEKQQLLQLNSKSVTTESRFSNKETHMPLSRSFVLPNHLSVDPVGDNGRCRVACGGSENILYTEACCGTHTRVVTTIPSSLLDGLPLPVRTDSAPLSATLTSLVKNRIEPKPILPKPPSPKKQAHTFNEVSKKADFVVVASSPETTTRSLAKAGKRAKVVPAKAKKTVAKPSYKLSDKEVPPIDTYIRFPKNMNEVLWNKRWKEAQEFAKKYGHCRIPITYAPNPELANWAKRQRYHYKKFKKYVLDRPGEPSAVPTKAAPISCIETNMRGVRLIKCLMTPQRLAKLDAIGFCMDLQEKSWDVMYERLCNYSKHNNGKTRPSKHFDYELWKWVGTQRYQMKIRKKREEAQAKSPGVKRNYKMPCIALDRVHKLNQINFAWDDKKEATDFSTQEH